MAKRLFHWSSVLDCVMHETDGDGNTLVTYTREPAPYGPLISEHRNGQEYVHHYDALGSTTMLTDETGSVTDTFTYDAWGNQVARTGTTDTPYRWVGRWGYQYDEPTGRYYVRARVYQPANAVWMSKDPLSFFMDSLNAASDVTQDVLIFDIYRYAGGAPTSALDPSGLLKGEGKYEFCCEIETKSVEVHVQLWDGANDTIDVDITVANRVYWQCCMLIKKGVVINRDAMVTKSKIGNNRRVKTATPAAHPMLPPIISSELKAMFDVFHSAGDVTANYVLGFEDTPALGKAFSFMPVPYNSHFVKVNNYLPAYVTHEVHLSDVFSHELGHVLGLGHDPNNDNLMYYKPSGSYGIDGSVASDDVLRTLAVRLTEAQCDSVRASTQFVH